MTGATMANILDCVIEAKVHGDNGRFAGIASTGDGRYLATVRGQLAADFLKHVSQRKRNGRPREEAAHIAAYANFEMIQHTIPGRKKAKLETCRVLNIGNPYDTEAQERQMQTKLKKAGATLIESRTHKQYMWAGNTKGNGRLWMALDGEIYTKADGTLAIDGFCWICQLGDKKAIYGRILVG